MTPNQNDLAFARLIVELNIASQEVVRQNLTELEMLKKQGDTDLNLGVMMYRKRLINDDDLRKIKLRHKEKLQRSKKPEAQKGQHSSKPAQPHRHERRHYEAEKPHAKPGLQGIEKQFKQDALINKQFGSYIIRRLVGSGGMGKVYLAENPLLKKYAAIKVLSYTYAKDEHYLKRFYREARMAAALQHPNIVQVYDFGQEHELNYLVMEYFDGETLEDKIKR